MPSVQPPLFSDANIRPYTVVYPSTRYQGSKRGLAEWIWANVRDLPFDTVLDLFGGTGVISHLFKTAGKEVTYNDYLAFNWHIGLGLIQNGTITLTSPDIEQILQRQPGVIYPNFIQNTFRDIYFTDQENYWLDQVVYNIDHQLDDPVKKALAYFGVFQACIIKRPYNLFHRANLYMRNADVERSFGNKTSWDTPFETHFRAFIAEANNAVYSNGRNNRALCMDALDTPVGADLVYLDPPYLNEKGIGVDYRDFYHFLEGLVNYDDWPNRIDYRSRHRRLRLQPSRWNKPGTILEAFEQVIARHQRSIIVISYRDDGIPSKDNLLALLRRYKLQVREAEQSKQYALSQRRSHEILLIGS